MINRLTLENGVRIMAEANTDVRSVSIGIWVKTGSRNEEKKENGISHLIEHMLFKGTKTRSAQEIAEAFDRIGGQVNAFTAKEYTCYYAKVLDEHAEFALDVLQDMFFHSEFEELELYREKNVVFEEIKMVEDTPDDIVHDLLSEASYGSSSLAYPILGDPHALESFTEKDLRDYMARFYTGDRVVVSVAGHFNEALLEALKETFAQVPPRSQQFDVPCSTFQPTVKYRQKESEQAHLCLGYPGLEIASDDMFALILLNNSLGGSMSSRLFQTIREERGLCYSVFSYHSAYEHAGMLTLYAGTQLSQLEELMTAIEAVTSSFAKQGMTQKELENGKEQLKGNLMLGLESTNSRMSRNGKNEMLLQEHRTLDELVKDINNVSIEQVNDLARRLLEEKPAVSLISSSETIPTNVFA
ncbi:M16 family metallopeptidase [Shouchella shacheensis]|uniref:M16 family metallopeptidase n=1 Tax=Shouchella shacheensis TaxID=1649580 RepID=UPI00073FF27B|nr:pitrilysin family protein [Shouchella shacheensis]